MKKKIFLAALFSALLLPALALAGMTVLDEDGMAEVKGQVGITIDLDAGATTGYMCYGDSDGVSFATAPGYFTFGGLTINDPGVGSNAQLTGLTLDLGTRSGSTMLVIGLPDLNGRIFFSDVRLGTSANTGTPIGSLQLGDVDFSTTSVLKLYAH
ncbi:MAG: hypothetical protein KKA60_06760 [Proteobacteria bacterium]|nr:hypothetical protein [Pseudomonadota bacterium]